MLKRMELEPTDENIINTMREDKLKRNKNIFALYKLINNLNCEYRAIGINGAWGSGKTFFVKQFKYLVDQLNKPENKRKNFINKLVENKSNESKPLQVVYYDAWEYDDEYDPLLSLVYSISVSIEEAPKGSWDKEEIKNKAIDLTNSLAAFVPGVNMAACLINLVDKCIEKKEVYEEIKEHRKIKDELNDWLKKIACDEQRLVIIVDELDRCRPDFAIKLLERMKHYFINPNITFIFSVNYKELKHTVKKFYGNGYDGYRYLERFFDLKFDISRVDISDIIDKKNFTITTINDNCAVLNDMFGLQIREFYKLIDQLYLILMNSEIKKKIESTRVRVFVAMYFLPIIVCLRIIDKEKEESFISGKDITPFLDFVNKLDIEYNSLTWSLSNIIKDRYVEFSPELLKSGNRESIAREIYEKLFEPDKEFFLKIVNNISINAELD